MTKKMRKMLVMVSALALILAVAIGGTIAWLADTSGTVTNVFETTDIEVNLTEENEGPYTFIPSVNITKDPLVTADCDVDYYVFVEVQPTGWTIDVTQDPYKFTLYNGDVYCTVDKGTTESPKWVYLPTVDGAYVYYQAVAAGETTSNVLTGNTVTVGSGLSENDMHDAEGNAQPSEIKLAFTAYAIQQTGFDSVSDAWTAAKADEP